MIYRIKLFCSYKEKNTSIKFELTIINWGMTIKNMATGGTVGQAAAPTINGLERPRGPGFESDPRPFPNPTPHLFSPANFLTNLHYPI